MDLELDALGMLDMLPQPGFCVKNQRIIKCNPAAQAFLLQPGTDIGPMLTHCREAYEAFSGGCLYLTLNVSGQSCSASVTRRGDMDLFLIEQVADSAELQAMALAARELREPLANVMTTAERMFPMVALEDDPALREQAARLNRGLYQMLRVIGNMSDAGHYAANTPAAFQTLDIRALMAEILTRVEPLAAHSGLTLRFDNLPQSLYCLVDPEKLERAVLNMVSNAMKFTPSGGTILAKLTRRGHYLSLTILDSGEGIPDALRSGIHTRYLRQPGIEDGRFGIGLGMVLIRSVAAMHGGTVLIDHPEDSGTRITMTLAIRQDSSGNVRSPMLRIDYAGERDHCLIELSDALPADAYLPEM